MTHAVVGKRLTVFRFIQPRVIGEARQWWLLGSILP
jgi:hypothetical protein